MAQRHRREEVERLLRRRQRRGLTYRELSEESGIPIPTLAWWSRKLEREEGAQGGKLVAIEVVEEDAEASGEAIEILIGGRVSVVVPPSVSEAHLQRVLRAVTTC